MNPFSVGTLGLVAATLFSVFAMGSGIYAWRAQDRRYAEASRRSVIAAFYALTACSILLVAAFLLDRFDLHYVAYNSNRTMPIFYKVSAFWGSLDGSMLLWGWLVSLFAAVAMRRHRGEQDLSVVASVLGSVIAFFTITILSTTNPFDPLVDELGRPFLPPDGLGLNPLLQNPGMVIHPPSLYLGFTGFTIPFAFAIAALITGNLDAGWIRATRRWVLFAWAFLTLGNVLGANWAYVELGWGGYWGWDPVENSALMPWFTGTAFLHSVMVQERNGMLKIWNIVLILATYWLTIFGTFLTRSGVVSSVHAFSNGTVGPIFLGYLGVAMLCGLALIALRWDQLTSKAKLESPFSREGAFVLNNMVFISFLLATLWGTTFPILNELFTGQKITIGAPYFNRVNAPLAIILLALMAIGPFVAWKRVSKRSLKQTLLVPAFVTAVIAVALWFAGIRRIYALTIYVFVIFTFLAMVLDWMRAIVVRAKNRKQGLVSSAIAVTTKNRRRYGGFLVHLGVLCAFVGISGNLFAKQKQIVLEPGQKTEVFGYQIELQAVENRGQKNYNSQMAIMDVKDPAGVAQIMWPEKRQYTGGKSETSTEVSIWSRIAEDFYLIFLEGGPQQREAVFRVHLNPLVQWIWIGSAIMMFGFLVATGRRKPTGG